MNPRSLNFRWPMNLGLSVPFLILIISFYIYEISRIPIWFDEAFTMQQARLPFFRMTKESLLSIDIVHFVYYVISHFLLKLIFDSLITLRLLSLFLTILTCLNLFKIACKLFDRNVAVLTSCFYLLLPVTFDYATQARSSSAVTFLVSAALLTLMRISDESRRNSILKTNLYFGLHIAMNITSVIILPLYLYFLHLRDRDLNLKRELLARFSLPLILAIPFTIIAKGQDKQIQWIGSQYSPARQIVTVLLFPFVESENRYRTWIFVIPVLMMFAFLYLRIFRFGFRKFQSKKVYFLISFSLFPSLLLWSISFVQPIFLTRYVAYSAIAFALILGIVTANEQNKFFASIFSIGIISFSLLNIQHIVLYRDSQYNWALKNMAISSGPKDPVLLSSPAWYTPMLKYHSSSSYQVENLNDFEIAMARDSSSECNALPKSVWLVGISDSVEVSDKAKLKKLGYVRGQAKAELTPGAELFSLDRCPDFQ